MADYLKPLPCPTEESAPFWEGCRKGTLLIQRCQACGTYRHYPRVLCPECHLDQTAWVPVSGKGKVYTYTISYRAFHPAFEVPYATVIVELDEGVRMASQLTDVKPEEVEIGMPVEVEFVQVTEEVTLPMFHKSLTSTASVC